MPTYLDIPRADAYIIGSGPNGLAAAITMAQSGCNVVVLEAQASVGGATRSAELTIPGFVHDLGSAVHPLAVASPFFRMLPLQQHGLEWIYPEFPFAHPFDNGAIVVHRSLQETAEALGPDARAYRHLIQPFLNSWNLLDRLSNSSLLGLAPTAARFGLLAIRSACSLASRFKSSAARAMIAGSAAHGNQPLTNAGTAAIALVLAILAHGPGWPIPRGGAQAIADALAAHLRSLGGEIVPGTRLDSLDQLPPSRAVLCDITPRQLLRIAANRLPSAFARKLQRFRYGPGAFKMDWALSGPIPWQDQRCSIAGTLHLGGGFEEIAASENAVASGRAPERPYMILSQPTVFDPSRAPAGQHTVWAYCHVPNGSIEDMTERMEAQIERFAPGFRKLVIARVAHPPRSLEQENANLIGGDISAGAMNLSQLLLRPTRRLHRTPVRGLYLCSASTPPGPGVHGMCGYLAASAALHDLF